MPRSTSDDPRLRTGAPLALGLCAALVAFLALLLAGAVGARPDLNLSEPDLEVIRGWISGGEIGSFSTRPGHLSKPAYLMLLRLALPEGGGSESEIRRFRLFQALFVWTGAAATCLALWRRGRQRASLAAALLLLLCLPIRDACDYVLTEGAAIGLALLFCAAMLGPPESRMLRVAVGGLLCALTISFRPNTGWTLFLLGLWILLSTRPASLGRAASLAAGFAAGGALLTVVGAATKLPLAPFAHDTSQAIHFGSAEYCWPHDLAPWPEAATPEETRRQTFEAARSRWRAFWKQAPADRWRSIVWRLTHAVLSAEALPSLWEQPTYHAADKAVRRWWWLAMIGAAGAAAACFAGGSGPWRLVPLFTLAVAAMQGAAFGAEPRYFLPLLPPLLVGLVLTVPTVKGFRAILAGAGVCLLLAAAVAAAPDATASDYAAVREPGHRFATRLPAAGLPAGDVLAVHMRLLLSPGGGLGYEVFAAGRSVHRHDPRDGSPSSAYLTLPVSGEELRQARRDGLSLEIRSLGEPGSRRVLYFPVVPPLLAPAATFDGKPSLPSAFGGAVRGGIPIWAHASPEPPRSQETPRLRALR